MQAQAQRTTDPQATRQLPAQPVTSFLPPDLAAKVSTAKPTRIIGQGDDHHPSPPVQQSFGWHTFWLQYLGVVAVLVGVRLVLPDIPVSPLAIGSVAIVVGVMLFRAGMRRDGQ